MKKILTIVVLVLLLAMAVSACSQSKPAAEPTKAPAAQEQQAEEKPASDLEGVPEVFTSGKQIKVAVIRNLPSDDHTKQFLDGARSEGESFGFQVDTFIADNDDAKFQELVDQAIAKGYDGLIISHGKKDYSYDMLKPAVDKGIKVVTFDTVIEKDGKGLPEITRTFQDDFALARLSLGVINEVADPARIIKLWWGPGVPPLDRRETVYKPLEDEGHLITLETIGPTNFQDVQGDIAAKVGAVLPKYPEGEIDAIWGSWDEMAKGAYTALKDAGRTDIKLVSIDISNQDINLMREPGSVWIATAAVDPRLIGLVDMRLLAKKFAGEETPDEYDLEAKLIRQSDLKPDTTMQTLNEVIPGWGDSDAFNEPWMDKLRAHYGK